MEQLNFSESSFSQAFLLGERAAFDYFYDRFAPVIYGLIFREDIPNEAISQVFKNTMLALWGELKEQSKFPPSMAARVIAVTGRNMQMSQLY